MRRSEREFGRASVLQTPPCARAKRRLQSSFAKTTEDRDRRPTLSLRTRISAFPLFLFALGAFLPRALAHPIHSSYAEADYRPDTSRLEIAIRLFTDDAEAAFSRHAGKKITVDATPRQELDALVFAYVRARFAVKTRDGTDVALTWVGRELKDSDQHLWIYVQCTVPGGLTGTRLRDRLLRDVFSDQINSIRVRNHTPTPTRQLTLLFLNDDEQTVTPAK